VDHKIISNEAFWREGTLALPASLWAAYRSEAAERGLLAKALGPESPAKAFHGGEDAESSDLHFAFRFSGSAARLQYVVLDSESDFPEAAGILRQWCRTGRLALIDVPCGAGAASLALGARSA